MRPDEKTLKAMDIFLCFKDRVPDGMYYSSSNVPFQIFFLMDVAPYFIAVIRQGEDYLLKLPSVRELDGDVTLFVCVESEDMIARLPELSCKLTAVLSKPGCGPEFYERRCY